MVKALLRAPFLIIGNLDNRRVRGFSEALAARGWPPPLLLSHREALAHPQRLLELELPLDAPLYVRLESCGEDPSLERELLARGFEALPDTHRGERISPAQLEAMPRRHGQILAPRQFHAGYLAYLDSLAEVLAERPGARLLSPFADVRCLFDKRESSRRYADAGVPVPEALAPDSIRTPDQLRAAMQLRRWPAVYVKLSCASSASCLAIYRYSPGPGGHPHEALLTTTEQAPEGRFNSLRLQHLRRRARIDALLGWLLAEGVQIERAVPKARAAGRFFDLRVVVIAGEPAFCVVRESPHPITNLHLGGRRGDLEALRAALTPDDWAAAMASCVRVSDCHGCHHLGVDLLLEPDLRHHRVIEANAFGDLLPGLRREGLSVYEWELERLVPAGPELDS